MDAFVCVCVYVCAYIYIYILIYCRKCMFCVRMFGLFLCVFIVSVCACLFICFHVYFDAFLRNLEGNQK